MYWGTYENQPPNYHKSGSWRFETIARIVWCIWNLSLFHQPSNRMVVGRLFYVCAFFQTLASGFRHPMAQ